MWRFFHGVRFQSQPREIERAKRERDSRVPSVAPHHSPLPDSPPNGRDKDEIDEFGHENSKD